MFIEEGYSITNLAVFMVFWGFLGMVALIECKKGPQKIFWIFEPTIRGPNRVRKRSKNGPKRPKI